MKTFIIPQRARPHNGGRCIFDFSLHRILHIYVLREIIILSEVGIFPPFFALDRKIKIECCDQKRNPHARTPNGCGAGDLIIGSSHAKLSLSYSFAVSSQKQLVASKGNISILFLHYPNFSFYYVYIDDGFCGWLCSRGQFWCCQF